MTHGESNILCLDTYSASGTGIPRTKDHRPLSVKCLFFFTFLQVYYIHGTSLYFLFLLQKHSTSPFGSNYSTGDSSLFLSWCTNITLLSLHSSESTFFGRY